MPQLSLSLLGTFQARLEGEATSAFDSDKTSALLAYLAIEAGRPHRRERLAGLFWSEKSERRARASLSQALHNLRKTLRDSKTNPFFLRDQQTIQFNLASNYTVDVNRLQGLLVGCGAHQKRLSAGCGQCGTCVVQAIDLYRGDFLAGFTLGDCAEFEEWLLMTREHLRSQMAQAVSLFPRLRAHYIDTLQTFEPVQPSNETAEHLQPNQPIDSKQQSLKRPSFLSESRQQKAMHPPPFVAREAELTQLHQCLDRVVAGNGQTVFVTGEAGRGKTALIQHFARQAASSHPDLIVVGGNCNAFTGVGDPFLPFRETLALLAGDVEARFRAGSISTAQAAQLWNLLPVTVQTLLDHGPDLIGTFLAANSLVERMSQITPPDDEQLVRLKKHVEQMAGSDRQPPQQNDLLQQVGNVLQVLSDQQPVLILIDDLQWSDTGTLNLLFHLGRTLTHVSLLIVGAYRASEVARGDDGQVHPLTLMVSELGRHHGPIGVALEDSDNRAYVDAIVDMAPNHLDTEFRDRLFEYTQGNSLFTLELLHSLRERGNLERDDDGCWIVGDKLDWDILPERVEATIGTRIARLSPELCDLLTVASVEGEVFTAEVVARVQQIDVRQAIHTFSSVLDKQYDLVRMENIRNIGNRRIVQYRFRHILFQRYLYGLLDIAQQNVFHNDVALSLESLYNGLNEDWDQIATQLAYHFEKATEYQKSAQYLRIAGEHSLRLSAVSEAIAQLTKGIALLAQVADTEMNLRLELKLQLLLSTAYLYLQGYDGNLETQTCLIRAEEISREIGETSTLFTILQGQCSNHRMSGKLQISHDIAEHLLHIANQADAPVMLLCAHASMGATLFWKGRLQEAIQHLKFAEIIKPNAIDVEHAFTYGEDPLIHAQVHRQLTLWLLGYPDRAAQVSNQAIQRGQQLEHLSSLLMALYFDAVLHLHRCDVEYVQKQEEQIRKLAVENELLFWVDYSESFRAWTLAKQGAIHQGIEEFYEPMMIGLTHLDDAGSGLTWTGGLLCEMLFKAGRIEEASNLIGILIDHAEKISERWWEPELHRLQGGFRLPKDEVGAETGFLRAIKIARQQGTKSWELRAATSLAELYQNQGKIKHAQDVLAPVYQWFTEGFETHDLQKAKELLEELNVQLNACS